MISVDEYACCLYFEDGTNSQAPSTLDVWRTWDADKPWFSLFAFGGPHTSLGTEPA